MPLPQCEHACALVERRGALLLELRPLGARRAAGRLTCFGGKLEPGESPEQALRRELFEELAWNVGDLVPAVALWKGSRYVAQFFTLDALPPSPLRARQAGHRALWAPWASLPGLPLSPWHAVVLDAWRRGQGRVDLLFPRSSPVDQGVA